MLLCDIDGTIALRGDRAPFDHAQAMEDGVNWPIVHLAHYLSQYMRVILITGREEKYRDITEYWLRAHNIDFYVDLVMRSDSDNRPDDVVKEELYQKIKLTHGPALYVLDDRNKVVHMWRRLGLTCLQVADGDF